MPSPSIPRRIAVAAYSNLPESVSEAAAVNAWLKARGLESTCGTVDDAGLRRRVEQGTFDLFIAVGGDGTVLRSAHLCAPVGVPILGINLGWLGFLIQIHQQEWHTSLENLLKGDYWIENRMMLRAEHISAGKTRGNWHALNEAAVCRGQQVRPVHLAASVDGHYLTTYVADGLVAATATGSTAYALASGGPILPPELRNILLVPVAPHLSVDRAVVLSEGTSVSILVKEGEAVLSVDGQAAIPLAAGDTVDVRAGEYPARFVRFGDAGYFYRNLTAHMNQNPSIGLPR
ncbi:MAG: NAD(+)/NADH kinase [Chloroflexi bacterium]|nr:NAD(+)/NADH kinase [Chloroflexota bacterium]